MEEGWREGQREGGREGGTEGGTEKRREWIQKEGGQGSSREE